MSTQSDPSMFAPRTPRAELRGMIDASLITQAIYVAARLGIADLLKDGPRGAEELAGVLGVNARNLDRVLRTLASLGIFAETAHQRFELTPQAEYLRSDVSGSMRHWALLAGQDWFQRPLGQLLHSVTTGQTAFDSVYDRGFFEYLGEHAEARQLFQQAQAGLTEGAAEAVLGAYDFHGIETIVDVGGGQGALLVSILMRYPEMKGILFDVPSVIERSRPGLTEAAIAERCALAGGDFFRHVPGGGDAYVLKSVLHNWDDEQALTILRNCRQAIAEKGKLLLLDGVVPSGNALSPEKVNDLLMMVFTGGANRTQAEYQSLLEASGFTMTELIPMPIGLSLIEAVPA